MNLKKLMKPGVPKPGQEFDQEDINRGLAEETSDHGSWATPAQLRKIVLDHLRKDEDYYESEEEPEKDDEKEKD